MEPCAAHGHGRARARRVVRGGPGRCSSCSALPSALSCRRRRGALLGGAAPRGARRDSRFLSSSALAGPQQSGSLLFLVLGSARRTLGTLAAFFLEMAAKRELANAVVLLPGLLRWCQCQRAHGNQPTGMGARQPRRPSTYLDGVESGVGTGLIGSPPTRPGEGPKGTGESRIRLFFQKKRKKVEFDF